MKIFETIRKFKCDKLDWHKPMKYKTFDGVNTKSRCKFCKRPILQDSQGNWFSIPQKTISRK